MLHNVIGQVDVLLAGRTVKGVAVDLDAALIVIDRCFQNVYVLAHNGIGVCVRVGIDAVSGVARKRSAVDCHILRGNRRRAGCRAIRARFQFSAMAAFIVRGQVGNADRLDDGGASIRKRVRLKTTLSGIADLDMIHYRGLVHGGAGVSGRSQEDATVGRVVRCHIAEADGLVDRCPMRANTADHDWRKSAGDREIVDVDVLNEMAARRSAEHSQAAIHRTGDRHVVHGEVLRQRSTGNVGMDGDAVIAHRMNRRGIDEQRLRQRRAPGCRAGHLRANATGGECGIVDPGIDGGIRRSRRA